MAAPNTPLPLANCQRQSYNSSKITSYFLVKKVLFSPPERIQCTNIYIRLQITLVHKQTFCSINSRLRCTLHSPIHIINWLCILFFICLYWTLLCWRGWTPSGSERARHKEVRARQCQSVIRLPYIR